MNKRALGSYWFILGIFAVCISFLLMLLLNLAYDSDNPICEEVLLEIVPECRDGSIFRFTALNLGNQTFSFDIVESERSTSYDLGVQAEKRLSIRDSSALEVVPYVEGNGNQYLCKSKTVSVDLSILERC